MVSDSLPAMSDLIIPKSEHASLHGLKLQSLKVSIRLEDKIILRKNVRHLISRRITK